MSPDVVSPVIVPPIEKEDELAVVDDKLARAAKPSTRMFVTIPLLEFVSKGDRLAFRQDAKQNVIRKNGITFFLKILSLKTELILISYFFIQVRDIQ